MSSVGSYRFQEHEINDWSKVCRALIRGDSLKTPEEVLLTLTRLFKECVFHQSNVRQMMYK